MQHASNSPNDNPVSVSTQDTIVPQIVIPPEVAAVAPQAVIPQKVAVSEKIPEFGNEKIVFTFIPYKHTQCEIHKLEKSEAKKLTEKMRKVNGVMAKNILCQEASGFACKPVGRSGDYACLFEDLPLDVQLLEIDYTGTGRIFGYLAQNLFNIVAITKRHLK
jgi:hypothetical protein